MDKRERLTAVIAGTQPDRPPVALWRHWPGDDQDADALAAAQSQWQTLYDWDLMKLSPGSAYSVKGWGVRDEWVGNIEGTRDYSRRGIEKPEDWLTLPILDPDSGLLGMQLDALRLLRRRWGKGMPILATIFSPLDQAKRLAGNEQMLHHLHHHPEPFLLGLKQIKATTSRYLDALLEEGVDGIFYATQHLQPAILSWEAYGRFGKADDLALLQQAASLPFNMVHLHGDALHWNAAGKLPASFLNWHDRDSGIPLASGLTEFDGAVCGGISRMTLYQKSPQAVQQEAADALHQTGGNRFMLGVGCVAISNTPLQNIRAMREAVH